MVQFMIRSLLFGSHPENLAYSDFKVLLSRGEVSNLAIDKQTIIGTLTSNGLEGLLPKEKLDQLTGNGQG